MTKRLVAYGRQHHLALIAIFLALGGSAYATSKIGAGQIRRNAIRSKHIKNGQVKAGDLQPIAGPTTIAANPATATDPCNSGRTGILCGFFDNTSSDGHWKNMPGRGAATFFKDRSGMVHLAGVVALTDYQTNLRIVILPPGYRPSATHTFQSVCSGNDDVNSDTNLSPCIATLSPNGELEWTNSNSAPTIPFGGLVLDGISYYAGG